MSSIITGNRPNLRGDVAGQIEHHFVNIAPSPAFGRIIAFDDGMLGAVKMLGGMLAAGLVAAADMAAGAADPQVKPFPAQCQAFLAAFAAGRHLLDGIQMAAEIVGHALDFPLRPAFAPDGARRSVGLAANLTLRSASADTGGGSPGRESPPTARAAHAGEGHSAAAFWSSAARCLAR